MATPNRSNVAALTPAQIAEKKAVAQKAKAENFVKLARKRMTNALKAISLVGQLGNRASYVYDEAQSKKIGDTLKAAVTTATGRFEADAKADASGFDF